MNNIKIKKELKIETTLTVEKIKGVLAYYPDAKYIAMDGDGTAYLYTNKPIWNNTKWFYKNITDGEESIDFPLLNDYIDSDYAEDSCICIVDY